MATDYVEDYEEVTGKAREAFTVETKVVTAAAETPEPLATEVAETK